MSNGVRKSEMLTGLQAGLTRRRLFGVAAAGAALPLLAACGGGSEAPPASEPTTAAGETPASGGSSSETPAASGGSGGASGGDRLIYAGTIEAKTLDPHFSAEAIERYILYAVYNTLMTWDTEFNIEPELAQSWEVAPDGSSITLTLQSGVKFHDGTDFNAEVAKWNLERILDPEVNSNQRGQLEPAIESLEAVDETTLVINLKKPWRPLLAALGERPGFVVSPTAVEQYGEDFGRNPVGTGPFKFVEWVPGSHILIERFEDYWDADKVHLSAIEYRHVPDSQVQVTMIKTGECHIIDQVDSTQVEDLRNTPGVVVEEVEGLRWIAIQCDVDKPPFDNADLRQAIAYGTDREAIRQIIFGGTGRIPGGPILSGWAYDPSLDGLMDYDPDKARELLEKSGFMGQTLTFTASNRRLYQDIAQLLQAQWQELGLNVQIETVDELEAFTLAKENKTNWTIFNWTPRADPDGLLRILWHSEGFQNTTEVNDPRIDELLDRAAGIYDTDEVKQLYFDVQRIILENADYVFLHSPAEYVALRDNVKNFVYNPDTMLRLRYLALE